jgi:LysM repeat protein/plastocyanin
MQRLLIRLGLPALSALLVAVFSLAPASAQGAYPGNGYMSGGGTYRAPSPYTRPTYTPPMSGYSTSGTRYGGSRYVVRLGDTLSKIATSFGTSVSALQRANPAIVNPDVIYAGQTLVIPNASYGGKYSGPPAKYPAPRYAPPPKAKYPAPNYAPPKASPYAQPYASPYGSPYAMPAPSPYSAPAPNPYQMPAPVPAPAPAPAPGTEPGSPVATVNLTARNMAFSMSMITVPAGAQVTIVFDNEDAGVPHNFAVYADSSAQQAIFRGQIVTGPAMTTYSFTAPSQPGTYFFRCDIHFTRMTGQFVVN